MNKERNKEGTKERNKEIKKEIKKERKKEIKKIRNELQTPAHQAPGALESQATDFGADSVHACP